MLNLFDLLFPPRADEAVLRNVSADGFLEKIAPRLVSETHPETVALFSFSDASVRAALHEAKYHGSDTAFRFLARALAEYLLEADEGFHKPLIVPVPLGRKRHRERGFNQIEEIARRASKELGIAVSTDFLERTRETASQVSLPRAKRLENMRGAFRATRRADPARTYIVLDDVITTGATLQAAAHALREAGAEHIVPLALAH